MGEEVPADMLMLFDLSDSSLFFLSSFSLKIIFVPAFTFCFFVSCTLLNAPAKSTHFNEYDDNDDEEENDEDEEDERGVSCRILEDKDEKEEEAEAHAIESHLIAALNKAASTNLTRSMGRKPGLKEARDTHKEARGEMEEEEEEECGSEKEDASTISTLLGISLKSMLIPCFSLVSLSSSPSFSLFLFSS